MVSGMPQGSNCLGAKEVLLGAVKTSTLFDNDLSADGEILRFAGVEEREMGGDAAAASAA